MEGYTPAELTMWSTFYALAGAAAATLTGLMFVVVTLVGRRPPSESATAGVSTFSTPTVIHFGAALFVSIIMCVPWPSMTGVATLVALSGFAGLAHMAWVFARARRLTEYAPDFEDWVWY